MGYHHLALACKDIQAIHEFYEGIMGFELVKVEVAPISVGGWGKHFFYRMEDDSKFIAFWELHDVPGTENFETALSKAAGLPDEINHISFDVADMDDLARRKKQWLDAGLEILEVDHNWCHSIYTKDPNGTMVEFCATTGSFTQEDRATALSALTSTEPEYSKPPASIDFISPEA
ncbi:MAG: catechol 2,3-dioxygenase-like lactoylglutathione lyase family enzyme [Halioglobus sp.]|jgi:catechol 2,3-dioxygenase-like lactoylglutathione lyase family enzyme